MNDKYRSVAVEIVEVIRRSEQGKTRPFICRGNDGQTYFVKGQYAGRRSQVCEWIAGSLAKLVGLPIAPFTLVDVPEELLELDFGLELKDLGAGLAFGSQDRQVNELTFSGIEQVPDNLQQDVLVFDWWVRNDDRSLGEKGGNPNLFWEPSKEELVVIDHNLAFDYSINREKFIDNHIFRNQLQQLLSGDFYRRCEYNEKLTTALQAWPQILKEIPKSWWYFDVDRAYALLKEFEHDDFWIWK